MTRGCIFKRSLNDRHTRFSPRHITFLKLFDGMVDSRSNSERPSVGVSLDTMLFMVKFFGKLIPRMERAVADELNRPENAGKVPDESVLGFDDEGVMLILQIFGRVTLELGPDGKVKLMREGLVRTLLGE